MALPDASDLVALCETRFSQHVKQGPQTHRIWLGRKQDICEWINDPTFEISEIAQVRAYKTLQRVPFPDRPCYASSDAVLGPRQTVAEFGVTHLKHERSAALAAGYLRWVRANESSQLARPNSLFRHPRHR